MNHHLFNASHTLPKNAWYPVCASIQLTAKPLASQIFDEDIVVFRDKNGIAQALHDRCLHLGARLSRGCVSAGHATCPYHGWEYDGLGQCVKIPSLGSKVPPALPKIRTYRCLEQFGYVWVWSGDKDVSGADFELAIEDFESSSWKQGSCIIKANATDAIDIHVDISHIPHVHQQGNLERVVENRLLIEREVEIRLEKNGWVAYWPTKLELSSTLPDSAMLLRFQWPNIVIYEFPTHIKAKRLRKYFIFTPINEFQCRLDFLIQDPTGSGTPGLRWEPSISAIIREDAVVLEDLAEAQQKRGKDEFKASLVPSDQFAILTRQITENRFLLNDAKFCVRYPMRFKMHMNF